MDAINDPNTIPGDVVNSETFPALSDYHKRLARSQRATKIVLGVCIAAAVVLRIAVATVDKD